MTSFTVTGLRHCNASPAADKSHEADMARAPSEKGFAQITARRNQLGVIFDKVFSSPAVRCMQTASGVASTPVTKVTQLISLCFEEPTTPVGCAFDALFHQLGYAPLISYLVSKHGYLVREHGESAWQALMNDLDGSQKNVLVVGHAVLLPAMVFSQLHDVRSPMANALLNCNLGECEGYTVLVEDGKIVNLDIIKDQK